MQINATVPEMEAHYKGSKHLDLETLELREYQVTSAWKSFFRNTLLVLPTGLGKTIVSVLHVSMILDTMEENDKQGFIVMIAPTRALLVQHQRTFREWLKIPDEDIIIVDGGIPPARRKKLYDGTKGGSLIIFMTPQTLSNDLMCDRFPKDRVCDVIFDEAHHARERHPYVLIYEKLKLVECKLRVLAMTASPGNSEDGILEVCQNLDIDPNHAIFKFRRDKDVQPYVHKMFVERVGINVPGEYMQVLQYLGEALREYTSFLLLSGAMKSDIFESDGRFSKPISKSFFLDMLKKYGRPEETHEFKFQVLSKVASCIKIFHAIELLQTQGLGAVLDYYESLIKECAKKPTKATKVVLANEYFASAMNKIAGMMQSGNESVRYHPKLPILKNLLESFLFKNPDSRMLVFAQYRASIKMILDYVGSNGQVKISRFVGQGNRTSKDKGMSRKRQTTILDKFRDGELNTLVATSVAEEGLDIAECDLVVFYETVASVIKFIQRQGRTARKRTGNVVILYTIGTMDEFKMRALDSKMARLKDVYYNVKELKPGDEASVGQGSPSRKEKNEPTTSITSLKRWQNSDPVFLKWGFVFCKEVKEFMEHSNVPVSMVEKGLADVTISKSIGVRIITLRRAMEVCFTNEIFGIVDGLRREFSTPFLILVDFGLKLDEGVTKSMIIEWVGRITERMDVKHLEASNHFVLGMIIKDLRTNSRAHERNRSFISEMAKELT
ncbi:MAG: helicase-related protein [Candidatus Hodarchaeota archaeon]